MFFCLVCLVLLCFVVVFVGVVMCLNEVVCAKYDDVVIGTLTSSTCAAHGFARSIKV